MTYIHVHDLKIEVLDVFSPRVLVKVSQIP
jgi:hypothetical protein